MYGEADVVERNGGDTPAQRAFEAYTAGLMEELCKWLFLLDLYALQCH